MTDKRAVVIVLGHGTDIGQYGGYPDFIIGKVKLLGAEPRAIVLCGGYTDNSRQSEAVVLYRLLCQTGIGLGMRNLQIHLEERSETVRGGLKGAKEILDDMCPDWRQDEIVIIGDQACHREIDEVAKHLFGGSGYTLALYDFELEELQEVLLCRSYPLRII